jgi:nucleoid-associated protein YgaU
VGSFIKSILSPTNEPQPTVMPETDMMATGKAVLERSEDGSLTPKSLPKTYTVKSGDTLWSVAQIYYGSGYNYVDIATANNMSNADSLLEGQSISLPKVAVRVPLYDELVATVESGKSIPAAEAYTVQKGDSLWGISVVMYGDGYGWTDIYDANKTLITDPGVIEPGWELSIPSR